MFPYINELQEALKSYYIANSYDKAKANAILNEINERRLSIAVDALARNIFYGQVDIPANSSGYQQTVQFAKDDIKYIINRGIASLDDGTTIAATNQGNKQRIITREAIAFQQLFAVTQNATNGQQTLIDLPQEIMFDANEVLSLALQNQTNPGWLFFHGCTLKDYLEDAQIKDLENEISSYLPEPQLVPIVFQFPDATAGTLAINASGGNQVVSTKNPRSIILTGVSTTASDCRMTLIDEARNQIICDRVEARGIASDFENQFTTYYDLPYPHLLRAGDRIRADILNGSDITASTETVNALRYLTFRGFTM
jgi:hypothetical protein